MIVLYILGIIIGLFVLLLQLRVKVHIRSDGELTLRVGAGPIMIRLLPKKQKKIRLKDFTHKKYLKKLAELKNKKADTKKKKSDKTKSSAEKREGITSAIDLVLEIIGRLEKYTSRLYANLDRLYLSVGGKDPSDAAIRYGVITPSVRLLLELLDCKTKLKIKSPENIVITCDYFSSDIKFLIDVTVKIKVLDALKTLIDVLVLKIKHDSKLKITSNERQVSQNGREQAK